MRKVIFRSIILISFAGFTACEEGDLLNGDGSAEAKLGEYYLEAEGVASYLYNIVDEAMNDSTLQATDSTQIGGVVILGEAGTYQLRFGNGVVGSDGITRKGKVFVAETGSYLVQGGKVSLSFENFSVDDRSIEGSMEVTNGGNGQFMVQISNFSLNQEFSFGTSKTITWESGLLTPNDFSDDKYSISGSFSGSEPGTGNSMQGNITTPIQYERACEYKILSGVIDLTLSGDSLDATSGSLDFRESDGCNNSVVMTINTTDGGSITFPKTFNGF